MSLGFRFLRTCSCGRTVMGLVSSDSLWTRVSDDSNRRSPRYATLLCLRHTVPKWLCDGYTKSKMLKMLKSPCCIVLYRTITVYHRVISLLAPCISGQFLWLRVGISWWENILWFTKELIKISTELHLRVIPLLPPCSSCRLRAPSWWQRISSVLSSYIWHRFSKTAGLWIRN